MTNDTVAAALDEVAVLLQLRGESDFRWKAYSNAAIAVRDTSVELAGLVAAGRLHTVSGLSGAVGEKVATLVGTGSLPYLDGLRASTPPVLRDMVRVPGLGPKKARALYDVLDPANLADLEAMAAAGRVAKVKGFGAKSAENVLAGVRFLRAAGDRLRFDRALRVGVALLDPVAALPGVVRAELTGELRRRCEIVGDVTLLVASDDPTAVLDAVAAIGVTVRLLDRGAAHIQVTAAVPYRTGTLALPATVSVVPPVTFGVALLNDTGPPAHVSALVGRAQAARMTLTRTGLTGPAGPVACPDEAAVYAALGLAPLPPELRDWPDAVEVAAAGTVPVLVKDSDIRGVFHNHTTASDGAGTLGEMAQAAADLGYEYFGVGDHSQSLVVANGLTPDRVRRQWAEIHAYNAGGATRVVRGTECDILAGGVMDFDDELMAGFEYVVASVHTLFGLGEAEQTARVCAALAHPAVTMLGHATGRLLLRREGYKIDLSPVIDAAARHGKMIEINAQPARLDMPWEFCRAAKAKGVPLVINPDAHSTADLEKVTFGVMMARKAGLAAADVFNTLDAAAVTAELARRRR